MVAHVQYRFPAGKVCERAATTSNTGVEEEEVNPTGEEL